MGAKTKTHVCKQDNRRFATQAALAQHMADAHCAPRPAPVRRVRDAGAKSVRSNRRSPATRTLGVDVAPSSARAAPGGSIVVSGEDRLGTFSVTTTAAVFKNYAITAGASLRLASLTKAFQRIAWLDVECRVIPQASMAVSGGYVCGFVMDPLDESVNAAMLTATQGAITKKWYETAIVRMPRKTELLYTSPGTDPRLNIPSVFWIISEGLPSTAVDVVVTFNWRVSLHTPTVERESDLSVTLPYPVYPVKANYNLAWKDKEGKMREDFSSLVPSALLAPTKGVSDVYHFFRVPTFIIEYAEGTGDTGTMQSHFFVYWPKDKKGYWSSTGNEIGTTPWQGDVDATQCLIPCQTLLRYDGTGNGCVGLSQQPPQSLSVECMASTAILESTVRKLVQRLSALEMELRPSKISSRRSSLESSESFLNVHHPMD